MCSRQDDLQGVRQAFVCGILSSFNTFLQFSRDAERKIYVDADAAVFHRVALAHLREGQGGDAAPPGPMLKVTNSQALSCFSVKLKSGLPILGRCTVTSIPAMVYLLEKLCTPGRQEGTSLYVVFEVLLTFSLEEINTWCVVWISYKNFTTGRRSAVRRQIGKIVSFYRKFISLYWRINII
jgi:hypothetical protein